MDIYRVVYLRRTAPAGEWKESMIDPTIYNTREEAEQVAKDAQAKSGPENVQFEVRAERVPST